MSTDLDVNFTIRCLTVVPSAANASILNVELAVCGDDTVPPANQTFYYENHDFGNQLLFVGVFLSCRISQK